MGQSLPVVVVMSFIGLHFPPIRSIYQQPLYIYMYNDMIYHHISLNFQASSLSSLLQLGHTPFPYYVNIPSLMYIGYLLELYTI